MPDTIPLRPVQTLRLAGVGESEAVAAAAGYFAGIEPAVSITRTVIGEGVVVVEATGRYIDEDGTSVVASCDIYEFDGPQIVGITSYNVEVEAAA